MIGSRPIAAIVQRFQGAQYVLSFDNETIRKLAQEWQVGHGISF
jgi:hypothetical protein